MRRAVVGRVRIGGAYRFRPTSCLYRVLFFALHGHTRQEQVVYEGLDGIDRGRRFCCPIWDFAVQFDPEEAPAGLPIVVSVEDRAVPAPECLGQGY